MSRILPTLLLIIVAAAGAWWLLAEPETEDAPSYSQSELKQGSIADVVSATGTLNPLKTVLVGSQVSGTLMQVDVDFNDRVKQGQVIARIDPAIFEAKRAEAAASLKNSEASRDKARVEVKNTNREYNRLVDLNQKKLVAETTVDAARFAWETARAEYKVRQANVEQSRAALQREQANLDFTTIYAPIDGVVISRDVDVGQTVAASLQAPTLFTIANDLARMQIEADVDETFIGKVQPEQAVKFTVFAYPKRTFHGSVAQVRLQPDTESDVVKYKCIIHVENADLALKPGMTATVSIEIAQRENVFTAPNAALRFIPPWPEDDIEDLRAATGPGEAILWRVDGDTLEPLTVTTGIVGDRYTEISGAELSEGLPIAVPPKRRDKKRKRRFGLTLF